MSSPHFATVDHTFLARLTSLITCSRCLRSGRKTPVTQVISPRHRVRTLCPACREQSATKR